MNRESYSSVRITHKITIAKLYMNKGIIQGDSNLTITDSLIWTGGKITKSSFDPNPMPAIIIPDTAKAVINGTVTIGRSLVNNGDLKWLSGNIIFRNKARFENYGTIYDMTDDSVSITKGTGYLVNFPNYGSYIKTGLGSNSIYVYFKNSGVVDVRSGFLNVYPKAGSAGTETGSYTVAEGSALQFVVGRTFEGSITGAGKVLFSTGGLANTIIKDTFNITGQTIFYSASLNVIFDTSCTLINLGSRMIESSGNVKFKSGETVKIDSLKLYGTNYSSNIFSDDSLIIKKYAIFSGGNIGLSVGPTIIDKDATVVISGYTRFHGQFDNYGIIRWENGDIELKYDQWAKTPVFNNYGLFIDETIASSRVVKTTNGYVNHYFNNYGIYQKKSLFTTVFTWENVFVNKESGILAGVDTMVFSKPIINSGTVSPGDSVGTLVLKVNYPSDSTTVVNIDLEGADRDEYDLLDIDGNATLQGTLNINLLNNYLPGEGELFEIMKFSARTDSFDVVNGKNICNCNFFAVQYTDTSVRLEAYAVAPPQAEEDTISARQDEPVEINVLVNDTDPDGDTLTVIFVGAPSHGTAVVSGDSTITYTPETGFVGLDTMLYVIRKRSGCIDSSIAIVDVLSTVGIEEMPFDSPNAFHLEPNHPNPFDRSTTFRFSLPETSRVELRIYSIHGSLVKILVSKHLPAGSYSYEWETSGLSEGIYIYRFSAGKFNKTGKMIRMK